MLNQSMSISYSQIAIFDGRLDQPFNNWDERHVRQGFSWRPGSVSFKTLIHSGRINMRAEVSSSYIPDLGCIRAIAVPFNVEDGASIEVASIEGSQPFHVKPGTYQLIYETGLDGNVVWVKLTFVPSDFPNVSILVQDDDLQPTNPLLMVAEPA